jgi:hypothetical protein
MPYDLSQRPRAELLQGAPSGDRYSDSATSPARTVIEAACQLSLINILHELYLQGIKARA